jgi:hypothetical protein
MYMAEILNKILTDKEIRVQEKIEGLSLTAGEVEPWWS